MGIQAAKILKYRMSILSLIPDIKGKTSSVSKTVAAIGVAGALWQCVI